MNKKLNLLVIIFLLLNPILDVTSFLGLPCSILVRSIFLIDKTNIKEEDCINCGLCNMVCPMGCDPLLNYKMDKCIKCGLCSYMCPSKREVVK